jgi:hypothetical protein
MLHEYGYLIHYVSDKLICTFSKRNLTKMVYPNIPIRRVSDTDTLPLLE